MALFGPGVRGVPHKLLLLLLRRTMCTPANARSRLAALAEAGQETARSAWLAFPQQPQGWSAGARRANRLVKAAWLRRGRATLWYPSRWGGWAAGFPH